MTRDQIVDLLMGRLGKRTSSITQQDIINEMPFVQEMTLEGHPEPPWFLLTTRQNLATVASTETVALPSDFLQEWEDGALYIVNDDGSETALTREDYDIIKYHKGETEGKPSYYDIVGESIVLRQIPDAVYTLKFRYYARGASLAGVYGDGNNIENIWLKYAADWFLAEVGMVIANQYLQSDKMLQMFAAQAIQAKKRVDAKNTIMEESNKQRFMEG